MAEPSTPEGPEPPDGAAAPSTPERPGPAEGAVRPPRVTEIGRPERVDRARHPVATALGVVALGVVLLAGLVGLAGAIEGDEVDGAVDEVILPRMSGRLLDAAQAELEELGLLVEVDYRPNEFVPSEVVVDQQPIAGARLEVGRLVTLEVSDGPAGVTVPDLSGASGAEAVRTLSVLGLVGVTEEVYDEEVPQTLVVGTDPPEGARAVPGSEVRVRVSIGPEPRTVPDVVGQPSLEAFAELGRSELRIGRVTRRVSSDAEPRTVLSLDPAPGQRVPRDFPVRVVVAADPRDLVAPDLVGLTRSGAAELAEGARVDISVRTEAVPPGDRRAGRVVSQSPVAGTPIDPGGTVTVTVAASPPPTTTTSSTTTTTTPG